MLICLKSFIQKKRQEKTAQENLQHPIVDAVFLYRNPQKNTEKIKIRYIG